MTHCYPAHFIGDELLPGKQPQKLKIWKINKTVTNNSVKKKETELHLKEPWLLDDVSGQMELVKAGTRGKLMQVAATAVQEGGACLSLCGHIDVWICMRDPDTHVYVQAITLHLSKSINPVAQLR